MHVHRGSRRPGLYLESLGTALFQLTACVAECYRASCVHVVNVCMYDSSYFPNSTIGIHASLPMVEFTMHFLVEVEEDLPLSNAHDHDIV